MKPTKEQEDIVLLAQTKKSMVVKAFAGCAKTTTVSMVANSLNNRAIYLAFNKVIAEEATKKMPDVMCKTIHSLAYAAIVNTNYRKKLQGWFPLSDLELLSTLTEKDNVEVLGHINAFCNSSYTLDKYIKNTLFSCERQEDLFRRYWYELIDEGSPFKITHSVYLKLYQLSMPVLGFQTIYLDEAQDSNEVTLDIALHQAKYGCQLIVVGDSYQAIYGWRGAVDALEKVDFQQAYLSESFRFTQQIADIATKVTYILGNTNPIQGKAKLGICKSKALIVRNNSTLLEELIVLASYGAKVKVIADMSGLWGKLYHISSLLSNQKPKYPDKELAQYKTKEALFLASETNAEIAKLLNCRRILCNQGSMHSEIQKLKKAIVRSGEDITLTTAHKSKGLEWDEVTLAEDLVAIPEDFKGALGDYLLVDQAGELVYVAITRARYKVNLPSSLNSLLMGIEL